MQPKSSMKLSKTMQLNKAMQPDKALQPEKIVYPRHSSTHYIIAAVPPTVNPEQQITNTAAYKTNIAIAL